MIDVDHVLLETVRRRFGVVHRPVIALDAWRSGRGWLASLACDPVDAQLSTKVSCDDLDVVLHGMQLHRASYDWLQTPGGALCIENNAAVLPKVFVSAVSALCPSWIQQRSEVTRRNNLSLMPHVPWTYHLR
jgi:hypothetical protein